MTRNDFMLRMKFRGFEVHINSDKEENDGVDVYSMYLEAKDPEMLFIQVFDDNIKHDLEVTLTHIDVDDNFFELECYNLTRNELIEEF